MAGVGPKPPYAVPQAEARLQAAPETEREAEVQGVPGPGREPQPEKEVEASQIVAQRETRLARLEMRPRTKV